MRKGKCGFRGLACVGMVMLLAVSANADRLIRYDRTTGQTIAYSASYARYGGATANNGSKIAVWNGNGRYVVDPGTGASTQISATQYTGANLSMSGDYLIYGSTLVNLSTGSSSSCPAGSKLGDDRYAYMDGGVCKIVNAADGSLINQFTPKVGSSTASGYSVAGVTDSSVIFQYYESTPLTSYWMQADATTGALTGKYEGV